MTKEVIKEATLNIKVKGKVLSDLERIAEGFSLDLNETSEKLLKKIIKKEIKSLDKENDEVFEIMRDMFVHPNEHSNVKSMNDIGDYLPD